MGEFEDAKNEADTLLAEIECNLEKIGNDLAKSPHHYMHSAGYEAVDVIEAVVSKANLTPTESYHLATVLKYALRAGWKDVDGNKAVGFNRDTLKAANHAHRLLTGEWL